LGWGFGGVHVHPAGRSGRGEQRPEWFRSPRERARFGDAAKGLRGVAAARAVVEFEPHLFGNAANLSLEARAGGCWCETLPEGGSVEHMHVVYLVPGNTLRLRGALGPFQGLGVDGAMTWSLKGSANATEISVTYAVGGYGKDGFDSAAKAADQVLGEQLQLLKKLIEAQPV
jgi:hypothetical protein